MVDYASQAPQAGFPGSFLNQSSQAGYSRFGSGSDFMSQVCNDFSGSWCKFYLLIVFKPYLFALLGLHGSWTTGSVHTSWL